MTHSKHMFTLAAASVLGLALLSGPAIAQEGKKTEPPTQAKPAQEVAKFEPRILPHDKLVGATVSNGLAGDKQATIGSVSDLVIDGATGKVRYGVIASGGTLGIGKRLTAVDWQMLTWDAEHARFNLGMGAVLLEKMPEFDPAKVGSLGAKAIADANADGGGQTGLEAAGSKAEGREAATAAREGHGLLLVSKVNGSAVLARADELGASDALFIEPLSGSTAFVCVAAGGVLGVGETKYVVPWAALKLVRPVGKDSTQFQIDRAKAEFADAPKLGDEGADVGKAEFRHKVYEFFGVAHPTFDPARNDADRKPLGRAGRR